MFNLNFSFHGLHKVYPIVHYLDVFVSISKKHCLANLDILSKTRISNLLEYCHSELWVSSEYYKFNKNVNISLNYLN